MQVTQAFPRMGALDKPSSIQLYKRLRRAYVVPLIYIVSLSSSHMNIFNYLSYPSFWHDLYSVRLRFFPPISNSPVTLTSQSTYV